MKLTKKSLAVLIASIGMVTQVQASTILFDSIGDAGSILYATSQDGANLSATIGFTLSSWTSTTAVFAVQVTNASSGAGTNRLTGFGIDVVTPALTGASEDSPTWGSTLGTVLPGFQQVDLCIWNGNSCQADAGAGLGMGGSTSFNLTLTTSGNFQTSGISFTSPYGVKFQAVGNAGRSFEFAGCIVGTPGCDGGGGNQTGIPEPTSLLLAGVALLALAGSARRKLG